MKLGIPLFLAVALSACNGNVQPAMQAGATGAGGAASTGTTAVTSSTTTATTGAGGAGGVSGSGGAGGVTGAGGGGAVCRAFDMPCSADDWCDFSNDQCGSDDWVGVCKPRPKGCPSPTPSPVCGCDGKSYASSCYAEQAGVDVAANAKCGGVFACGPSLVCQTATQYCQVVNGFTVGYQCNALPASCLPPNAADCTCMPTPPDCGSCSATAGQITVQHGCG